MGLIKSKFSKKPLIGGDDQQEKTTPTLGGFSKGIADKKPSLGGIKTGGLKLGGLNNNSKAEEPKAQEKVETPIEEIIQEPSIVKVADPAKIDLEESTDKKEPVIETEAAKVDEEESNPPKETVKPKAKRKSPAKKKTEDTDTVTEKADNADESRRVSINEMDSIMQPIIAPTTEAWEDEKKEVLDALKDINIGQDMSVNEVKHALAALDELRFEIFPRQHDAERCFDGTTQIYKRVKSLAIAEGTASNAETRKALGIIALKNYTTPSGEVIDLNEYMLYIEEKHKFYLKMLEAIQFKSYSLVNFNKTLATEKV